MTRIDKLYSSLLANPRAAIPFRDFEKLLRAFGFEHVAPRQSRHLDAPETRAPLPDPADRQGRQAL